MSTPLFEPAPRPSIHRTVLRLAGCGAAALLIAALLTWSVLAIYFSNLPGETLRAIAAAAFGAGTLAAFAFLPDRRRTSFWFIVAFAGALI